MTLLGEHGAELPTLEAVQAWWEVHRGTYTRAFLQEHQRRLELDFHFPAHLRSDMCAYLQTQVFALIDDGTLPENAYLGYCLTVLGTGRCRIDRY